ncbi:MAG TPA: hypothetical protein VGO43_08815 [Pyrinomonadaceae bacterium]|jgi:hypothetical protein|nr:hypothetical protein [Pyrinomonadaceae bacterium]
MESYEVLETAIPKQQSSRVAQLLGVTADYVRRWRREPDNGDSPNASGQRSILDRICDLIDAVYLVNPDGSGLIVNHIESHYEELLSTHAKPIACRETQAAAGADLLTKATDAINSLHIEGCTDETLCDLIRLRDAADVVINQVEKTMSQEDQS